MDPVIVPPPPTITQPLHDDSPGLEAVQRAFDKALPARGPSSAKASEGESPSPAETPQTTPAPESPPSPAKPEPKPEEADAPSFLEQALRGTEKEDGRAKMEDRPPKEDEWPEELPTFKSSDEAKARYKKWREAHKELRTELETIRKTPPSSDPETKKRIEYLENQAKGYQEVLSRYGVENSIEFQQNILRPLYGAWNEAARIVHESGGDPNELARVMTLQGKAQFEALDDLFTDLPESAKAEAHDALRVYRRYEDARRAAMAEAPKTLESLRQRETEREIATLTKQREGLKGIFDHAVKSLRDDARLEVLLRTDMPEGSWWNEQADKIVQQARDLYLENTDMNKVAVACLLAPAAEVYRKLWVNSQKKIGQLQKVVNDRVGSEPNLSESGGSQKIPASDAQMKDDLKKPFHEIFLREFHRQQAGNR
jgi:hypothetical protein